MSLDIHVAQAQKRKNWKNLIRKRGNWVLSGWGQWPWWYGQRCSECLKVSESLRLTSLSLSLCLPITNTHRRAKPLLRVHPFPSERERPCRRGGGRDRSALARRREHDDVCLHLLYTNGRQKRTRTAYCVVPYPACRDLLYRWPRQRHIHTHTMHKTLVPRRCISGPINNPAGSGNAVLQQWRRQILYVGDVGRGRGMVDDKNYKAPFEEETAGRRCTGWCMEHGTRDASQGQCVWADHKGFSPGGMRQSVENRVAKTKTRSHVIQANLTHSVV